MTSLTRGFTIGIPGLGVILMGALLVSSARKQPHSTPLIVPPSSPYSDAIAATGIIEAAGRNYSLAPPIGGQVVTVFVTENQLVKRGEPLYAIDDSEQRSIVRSSEANVEKAKAELTTTESDIATQLANIDSTIAAVDAAKSAFADAEQIAQRAEGLHQERLIADREFVTSLRTRDTQKAKLEQAQAQVDYARAQLQNARARHSQDTASLAAEFAARDQQITLLQKLIVRAPVDGKVLQINTRAGEYLSSTPTTTPMLLGDTDLLQVRADVDEMNASRVVSNSPARASLKGNSDQRFDLQFVRIDPYMIPKQNLTGSNSERVDVRVLQVVYRFTPPPFPVYVGQQVDVFIRAR